MAKTRKAKAKPGQALPEVEVRRIPLARFFPGEVGDDWPEEDDPDPADPAETQLRFCGNDDDTVAAYASDLGADRKLEFPPVKAFEDDQGRLWLFDGHHTLLGYRDAGRAHVPCLVWPGTKEDATFHAMGANAAHGLRRTNLDKDNVVKEALLHPYTKGWTDRKIAEHCKVSHPFVGKVRERLAGHRRKTAEARQEHAEATARRAAAPGGGGGNVTTPSDNGASTEDAPARVAPEEEAPDPDGRPDDGAFKAKLDGYVTKILALAGDATAAQVREVIDQAVWLADQLRKRLKEKGQA
jgi:hypothetical protein